MQNSTILVIDDSATIRRLASSALSSAGYKLVLAENAEEGLRLASSESPDLILLDHQLPGTTGFAVCQQLLANDSLKAIPIILSSTLRKQAYVEYADCANVIDMLPKPYNEELLKSTVEHALTTGTMVVDSQSTGSAVPEVINQIGTGELSGDMTLFSLREVIDFLNNGNKTGALEVESANWRARFYLGDGRIQAITANGIDTSLVFDSLPESLSSLAPVLKLAITGHDGSELQGLVQLLNNKVLDPRLLKKLLRHQAACLAFSCLSADDLKDFRFEKTTSLPPMFRDLPLDISLAALLVEGASNCSIDALPADNGDKAWVRRSIRGQSLDRAGMSAKHQRIVGLLSQPQTTPKIAETLGWDEAETRSVLYGLQLADLLECQTVSDVPSILIFEPDAARAKQLREVVLDQQEFQVRIVKDRLSVQLVLKRENPQAILIPSPTDDEQSEFADRIAKQATSSGADLILVGSPEHGLPENYTPDQLWQRLSLETACEA